MQNTDWNWGFSTTGVALGSEGALSMPEKSSLGLGDPMVDAQNMLNNFSQQVERRYGNVSTPTSTLWDPRGDKALSDEPGDYKTTDLLRPDEIPVQINPSDDQLSGGDPVLAPYVPDSSAFAEALFDRNIGLSPEGAATLADSLQAYDKRILNTIYLPNPVEPQITNDVGLTTAHGGLPDAFYDPNVGVLKKGVPEAIERVVSQQAEYQHVDENGVVHKYESGTGPYDAVRKGIIAPPKSAPSITPAELRAYPRKFVAPPSLQQSEKQNLQNVTMTAAEDEDYVEETAHNVSQAGEPKMMNGAAGNGKPQGPVTGGGTTYGVESGDYVGDDAAIGGEALVEEGKPFSKWWLLLLAGLGLGGAAIAYGKRGKKGRK